MMGDRYSFSLYRAQKNLDKLKPFLEILNVFKSKGDWSSSEPNRSSIEISVDSSSSFTSEQVSEHVAKSIEKIREENQKYLVVYSDVNNIKDALFRKNIECGVNELLREMELVKKELEQSKLLLKQCQAISEKVCDIDTIGTVYSKKLETLNTNPNRSVTDKFVICVSAYSKEELELLISIKNKRLTDIEDHCSKLNQTINVEVELSDISAKFLGLK